MYVPEVIKPYLLLMCKMQTGIFFSVFFLMLIYTYKIGFMSH